MVKTTEEWRLQLRISDVMARAVLYLKQSLPFFTCVLAILGGITPASLAAADHTMAMPILCLVIPMIFYWLLYRPDLLPILTVLLLGMLQDIVNGPTLGICMLSFLVLFHLTQWQRRFLVNRPFWLIWLAFAVTALLIYVLTYLVNFAVYGHWAGFWSILAGLLVTIVSYPLISWLAGYCYRILPDVTT